MSLKINKAASLQEVQTRFFYPLWVCFKFSQSNGFIRIAKYIIIIRQYNCRRTKVSYLQSLTRFRIDRCVNRFYRTSWRTYSINQFIKVWSKQISNMKICQNCIYGSTSICTQNIVRKLAQIIWVSI